MFQIKYNLNADRNLVGDDESNVESPIFDMGFGDVNYYGIAKLSTNKYGYGTIPYKVYVGAEGIVCLGLEYHPSTKISPSYYSYTGRNGFIPSTKIQSDFKSSSFLKNTWTVNSSIGLYKFIFNIGDGSDIGSINFGNNNNSLLNTSQSQKNEEASQGICEGNLFDLHDDETYVQMNSHIRKIIADLGHSDTQDFQPLAIEARYLPTFNSDIFKKCIHIPKVFIVSRQKNGVLLLQTAYINQLFFFTGKSLFIPNNALTREAVYTLPPKRERLILVGHQFIIDLMTIKLIQDHVFKELPYNPESFNQLAGMYNPTFLPKIEYRNFIEQNYSRMRKAILKTDQGNSGQEQEDTQWYDVHSLRYIFHSGYSVGKTCILVALVLYLVLYVLHAFNLGLGFRTLSDAFVDIVIIFTILFGLVLLIAWLTYLYSQTVESTPATRLSVILGTLMLFGNIGGYISMNHYESHLTHSYLNKVIKSNYQIDANHSASYGNNLKRIKFKHHHIYGYDQDNNLVFNYHYSDAYYKDARDGIVFDGDYSNRDNNNLWKSNIENYVDHNISDSGGDSDNYTGYDTSDTSDSIMAEPSGRHQTMINFTGDALDYSASDNDGNDDHTELADENALTFRTSKKYPKIKHVNNENNYNQFNENNNQEVSRQENQGQRQAQIEEHNAKLTDNYDNRMANIGFKYGTRRCFILDNEHNQVYISVVKNGQVALNNARYITNIKNFENFSARVTNKLTRMPYNPNGNPNIKEDKVRWEYYLADNPYIVYNMKDNHKKSVNFYKVSNSGVMDQVTV